MMTQHSGWLYWLLAFLCLALIASLAANWLLFNKAKQYYWQLNGTRLDPLGLTTYPTDATPNAGSGKTTVVFFGDSRVAEWPAPAGPPSFEFTNRGIGAQTTTQVQQRFDNHVEPLSPDILIIQVGINDLKTIPLFPQQKEEIIRNCRRNIQQIVAQSTASGTTVILTTIFPVGDVPLERRPFWSADIAAAVVETNRAIHQMQAENVIIFDAYALLASENGKLRLQYAIDELHLNEAGYDLLNQELTRLLQQVNEE